MDRTIRLYYLTEFVSNLGFTLPIWVTYQLQYLTLGQMSLIRTIHIIFVFLLEIPTGALADVIGRRLTILIGSLIFAAGLMVAGTADSALKVATGEITIGVGVAFISGANLAVLFEYLKDRQMTGSFPHVRSRGVFMAQIGIVVSSILAGYLYAVNRTLPYAVQAAACIAAGIMYLFMHEPAKPGRAGISVAGYLKTTANGFRAIFSTPYIRRLSALYIIFGGITWSWQVFFNQIYAASIGYDEIGRSWLFGIIRFVNGLLLLYVFSRKRFTKKLMFVLLPVFVIITGLLAPIRIMTIGTMLLFSMTIASTLKFAVLDGYVNEGFDSRHRATALSALNMFVRLIYMLIVSGSSLVIDRTFPGMIYAALGIIAIFTLLPLGLALRRHDDNKASAG